MFKAAVIRQLYRSLLKAAKPYSDPSPNSAVLSSMLHRTGTDDGVNWDALELLEKQKKRNGKEKGSSRPIEAARDLTKSYASAEPDEVFSALKKQMEHRGAPHRVLFRRLLREIIDSPTGRRQMQFPHQAETKRLYEVIRREFREENKFDAETRQQVAFIALRELSKKLSRFEELSKDLKDETDEERRERNCRQAAKFVTPLPLDPQEYLKAGTFLLAHPFLSGYFRRTVICLLDHSERTESSNGGTYGLIVNRIGTSPSTGKDQTLHDVLRTMPPQLAESFGGCAVRDGGPVHMSLQMLHTGESTEDNPLGGNVLSVLGDENDAERCSSASHPDRPIYFQGDVMKAAIAVKSGSLARDDVCFYSGASCWEVDQLESEIQRGYWLPCRGPTSIALTGSCDHNGGGGGGEKPLPDLWLSMMSAMGHEEASFAHFVFNDEEVENGEPCDAF